MGRRKINISKDLLRQMYLRKGLNAKPIAEKFGCSWSTVINRLKEFAIPLKSPAVSRMKYPKKDFDNSETKKAYMIGFRIGDLNVYKVSANSETIVVRCHTTQQMQVDLIKGLFSEFGRVDDTNRNGHYYTNCFLNNSFEFLVPKDENAWNWITKKTSRLAFIAGYTDAEGNFIINQGRARFKIDSYDKDVLDLIALWLRDLKIEYKMRLIFKKRARRRVYNKSCVYNKDLWRININKAKSLEKFIKNILPHIKHEKRISDAKIALKNVYERRLKGTI